MKVKIINKSGFDLPKYATANSAGMDLRTNITESITLKPLERYIFPTGIYIQLPSEYYAAICPRSGLAAKHGISIVNAPGTIDADYTGEIKVILVNLSNEEYTIEPGERIAQMIIHRYEQANLEEVEVLDETERGEGGFGHTGKF